MTGPTPAQIRDGQLDVLAVLDAWATGDDDAIGAIAAAADPLVFEWAMFLLLRDALVELAPDSAVEWIARKRAELVEAETGGE